MIRIVYKTDKMKKLDVYETRSVADAFEWIRIQQPVRIIAITLPGENE